MSASQISIVKRDGKQELFSIEKIKNAIRKAFLATGGYASEEDLTIILSHVAIRNGMSVEEIRDMIGADSLGYISLDSLRKSLEGIHCGTCSACFDGNYVAGEEEAASDSIHNVKYN